MKQKNKIILLLSALIILILFISYISPLNIDLKLYLTIFFLIYFVCLMAIWFFLDLAYQNNRDNNLKISTILAFTPISILAISSLSNLSPMDVVFAVSIPLIIVWILLNRKPKT